jgi:hypothetical protein
VTDSASRLIKYPGRDRNPNTILKCGYEMELLHTMLLSSGIREVSWSWEICPKLLHFRWKKSCPKVVKLKNASAAASQTPLLTERLTPNSLLQLQTLLHESPSTGGKQPATMATTPEPISVLFVCLGNICRSTMAEGIFKSMVSKPPYQGLISVVDSCGTGAYHTGSSPDSRTMSTLKDNGITDYDHAARKVSGTTPGL